MASELPGQSDPGGGWVYTGTGGFGGYQPRFCDQYIEVEGDPFAGTYCKLLAGHDGPHSAHYPAGVCRG